MMGSLKLSHEKMLFFFFLRVIIFYHNILW